MCLELTKYSIKHLCFLAFLTATWQSTASCQEAFNKKDIHARWTTDQQVTDSAPDYHRLTSISISESVSDKSLLLVNNTVSINGIGIHSAKFVTPLGLGFLRECKTMQRFHCFELVASDMEVYQLVENSAGLRTLECSLTPVGDGLCEKLAETHRQLRAIRLLGCRITDKSAKSFAKLPQLEHLVVGISPLGDEFAMGLKGASIKILSITDSEITDEGIAHLAELPNLTELNLGSTRLTRRAATKLATLKSLKVLSIHGPGIDDDFIIDFARTATISDLSLNGSKVSARSLEALSKNKSLKRLSIMDVATISDSQIAAFQRLRPDVEVQSGEGIETTIEKGGLEEMLWKLLFPPRKNK